MRLEESVRQESVDLKPTQGAKHNTILKNDILNLCRWSPVQGGDRQIIKRAQKVLPGRFSGLLKSPPKVPEKTSKRTPRADGTTLGVLFHIFLKENGPTREGGGEAAALPCGARPKAAPIFFQKDMKKNSQGCPASSGNYF